MKAAVTGG